MRPGQGIDRTIARYDQRSSTSGCTASHATRWNSLFERVLSWNGSPSAKFVGTHFDCESSRLRIEVKIRVRRAEAVTLWRPGEIGCATRRTPSAAQTRFTVCAAETNCDPALHTAEQLSSRCHGSDEPVKEERHARWFHGVRLLDDEVFSSPWGRQIPERYFPIVSTTTPEGIFSAESSKGAGSLLRTLSKKLLSNAAVSRRLSRAVEASGEPGTALNSNPSLKLACVIPTPLRST